MADLQLQQRMLLTDVGELWLAHRPDGRRCVVRLLDHRMADRPFRDALDELRDKLKDPKLPRVLPIVQHDRLGDHYFIEYGLEYGLDSEIVSLPKYVADHTGPHEAVGSDRGDTGRLEQVDPRSHWLDGLHLIVDLARFHEGWRASISPSIGLHAGRLVVRKIQGAWLVHLLPCPKATMVSPFDLVSVEPDILAALAPERLRGSAVAGLPEDVYAAGILVLQLFGHHPPADLDNESRIEYCARGLLMDDDLPGGRVESALLQIPAVTRSLSELQRVIQRCTEFVPEARPRDLGELRAACEKLLAVEATVDFAAAIESGGRPSEALQFLEWSFDTGRGSLGARQMAVDTCRRLGLPSRELLHLERLLRHVPGREDLARRRLELRYDAYMKGTPAAPSDDPEGDWLLGELQRVRPSDSWDHLDEEERTRLREDLMRSASIHGRRGEAYRRAQMFWELTKVEWTDIRALFLYGLSLRDLLGQSPITPEYREQVATSMRQLLQEARHRVERLKEAELIMESDRTSWNEAFESLLSV